MRAKLVALFIGATWVVTGCGWDEMKPIKEPFRLADGSEISVAQLRRGQEQYILYCRPCHGVKGDGRGPAGIGLRPPPRNFIVEDLAFKFGGVEAGSLPPDAELRRIIKRGLDGTAMLPWDVPDPVLNDIIAYIKSMNQLWTEEEPEAPVEITPDPWKDKKEEAITRGKKVYHGLAQCLQCHPAYATKQEIYEASKELTGNGITSFRPSMYQPIAKYSESYKNKILPPDFGRHPIKAGKAAYDLFRTVGAGIGGTAMPMWKGSVPDKDIWAIAHYVEALSETKDKPAYANMMKKLKAEGPFVPPTETATASQ